MASRWAVASSSDWQTDRKAMPGTAAGTQALSTFTVFSATSSTEARCFAFVPDITVVGVSTVHQHFRLDDRNDAFLLAERGVARERVLIGDDRRIARDALADVDHRAPLRELGAEPAIFH